MLMPVPKSLENAPAQVLTQLRYCEIIFVRYFVDSINPNGNFFQRFIAQICQIYFIRSYDLKINCFWFQAHKLFKNNWTRKVETEKSYKDITWNWFSTPWRVSIKFCWVSVKCGRIWGQHLGRLFLLVIFMERIFHLR